MKKKYIKPQFHVEDFTMSQQIASGCNKTEGAQQYQGGCEFIDDSSASVFFNDSIFTCEEVLDQYDCQDGPNSYGGYFFS